MAENKKGKGSDGIAAENRVKAFELYKMGWTQRNIAKHLSLSPTRIHQYIHEALRELTSEQREIAKDILALEIRRLDDLLMRIAPAVARGDLYAIDRQLKIMERRARYLGLDKPEKHEHTVTSLEALVAGDDGEEK